MYQGDSRGPSSQENPLLRAPRVHMLLEESPTITSEHQRW